MNIFERQLKHETLFAEKYISATCSISNGAVYKDGAALFKNDSDLPAFLLAVYHRFGLNYPKFYKMDNLSKLGWLAAEILLKDSFDKDKYQPEETGLILANANSSLDDDIKYFESIKEVASPSLFVYTLPNIVIGEISIRHRFKGEHAFFIQEYFDAGFIAQQVNYLLDNNKLQACICGWVDVLGDDYKAVLFLVEKGSNGVSFSAGEMERVFENG